jgi:hypothetical protein
MFLYLTVALAGEGNFEEAARARMQMSFEDADVQAVLAAPDMPYEGRRRASLPLEANSSVQGVVVYRDRALVTRSRTVPVSSGLAVVEFTGLPLDIDTNSLHAVVLSGEARIIGVTQRSASAELTAEERATLKAELKTLSDEVGAVRDRIASLLAQQAYLRRTLLGPLELTADPSVVTVKANLAYVGEAEAALAKQLREEEERARELDEQISPILIKLQDPLATGVSVRVEVDSKGGTLGLGLRYKLTGAGWEPAYNARLLETGNKVEIEYFGIVQQQTGESWADAELVLSTGNPVVSGEMPRLSAWYVGGGAVDVGYTADERRGVRTGEGGELVDSNLTAGVQGSGVVAFVIPGKRTVPGDGSPIRLPIGTQTFDVTMELATVPRLVPEVYRQGHIRYGGQVPMLPGVLSSFADGTFIGSTRIGAVVPGEELVLSLGTDSRVKVERVLVSRNQSYVGIGRNTVRYELKFKIKVSNYGKAPVEVMVADQVPVPAIEDVKVTVETPGVAPMATNPDDPPGILRWKLTLAPGETKVVEFGFTITAPYEVARTSIDYDAMY